MPETFWTVRWPDGSEERLYSPSSVVAELFEPGASYGLADFLTRARTAMERASARVEQKYGYACTSALATLQHVEGRVAGFDGVPDAQIACLTISR
jgi:putative flavoprotein involved in K+ transport